VHDTSLLTTLERLFNRMEERRPLTAAQKGELQRMASPPIFVPAKTDYVLEGAKPSKSSLLLTGFACRYTLMPDGRRQITAIHVPGDFVDLHSLPLEVMDHTVAALTDCQFSAADHRDLLRIISDDPDLALALWRLTLLDGALHREWIVAFAMNAVEHLAHLLCELFVRLKVVGLTEGPSFEFPVTQEVLAETLGLSPVHVNRTLQDLRANQLIAFDRGLVTILDWTGLREVGKFDAGHLHLGKHRDVAAMIPAE